MHILHIKFSALYWLGYSANVYTEVYTSALNILLHLISSVAVRNESVISFVFFSLQLTKPQECVKWSTAYELLA
jgi:hypothetical protein